MKKYIYFNSHSFVDVITNSSTELFVGDTNKTKKQILDILNRLVGVYNELNPDWQVNSDDILELKQITSDNLEEWIKTFMDWGFPWWIDHPELDKYSDGFIDHTDSDFNRILNDQEITDKLIGLWIIVGTEDNSIPYQLFDMIRNIFENNSERWHLG